MNKFEVTDKKKKIWAEIIRHICNHRVLTIDELAKIMRMNNNTVYSHLRKLIRLNFVGNRRINFNPKGSKQVYFIGIWRKEIRDDILLKYCNED